MTIHSKTLWHIFKNVWNLTVKSLKTFFSCWESYLGGQEGQSFCFVFLFADWPNNEMKVGWLCPLTIQRRKHLGHFQRCPLSLRCKYGRVRLEPSRGWAYISWARSPTPPGYLFPASNLFACNSQTLCTSVCFFSSQQSLNIFEGDFCFSQNCAALTEVRLNIWPAPSNSHSLPKTSGRVHASRVVLQDVFSCPGSSIPSLRLVTESLGTTLEFQMTEQFHTFLYDILTCK